MKTSHTSIIFLLLALIFSLSSAAQEMTVKSLVSTPMDQTANLAENMYQDKEGDYGGLVKVRLAAPGATFEGWVLKQEPPGAGEYWVFMAKGSNKLLIKVPNYLPIRWTSANTRTASSSRDIPTC